MYPLIALLQAIGWLVVVTTITSALVLAALILRGHNN